MTTIEFRQFSKKRGGLMLHELNFKVETGYITGLIGPNGSGKTTLIRAIMNLIRPDAGEVLVFGHSYKEREREIKRRIGFVYDEDFFYNHLTVKEMGGIVASFYPTWNEGSYRQYLERFAIPARRKVRELSKGMKTKFSLAVALSHEPELLIMDEPTSGLDSVFRREILAILSDYIRSGTRSVLFSTHISADLDRIADFIVYMQRGQLRFCGSKEELIDAYWLAKGPAELLRSREWGLVGVRQNALGFEGLLPAQLYADRLDDLPFLLERPSLDDIMVYTQEEK